MFSRSLGHALVISICAVAPARAQPAPSAGSERPTVTAARLNAGERVELNGVLDDPAWVRAGLITSFTQSDPQNGAPATERTEIRILFDEDRLYIGAEFFDTDPAALLGNQMVRDGSLDADDRFIWVLDPLYNQRSGYYFELNPAGAMGDAQLVSAGSSVGTRENRAWDGVWMARVRRHDRGWTAEVEIPFRTLNFDPRQQAWGANFQRTVRRKNEDHRKYSGVLRFAPRPANSRWLRQVAAQVFPEFFTDTNGHWVERSYQAQLLDLDFQSGDTLRITLNPAYSKLQRDFRIGPGLTLPAGGEYHHTRHGFNITTANRRMISGTASYSGGTFFSGSRRDYSASLNIRPRPGVLATMTASYNRIELPEGTLTTRLLRGVVNTQFNPFMSISNNIQHDSVSRLLGWQLRYRWIVEPGNDLYFVWFHNWQDTGPELTTVSRSAAVKAVYTHSF